MRLQRHRLLRAMSSTSTHRGTRIDQDGLAAVVLEQIPKVGIVDFVQAARTSVRRQSCRRCRNCRRDRCLGSSRRRYPASAAARTYISTSTNSAVPLQDRSISRAALRTRRCRCHERSGGRQAGRGSDGSSRKESSWHIFSCPLSQCSIQAVGT